MMKRFIILCFFWIPLLAVGQTSPLNLSSLTINNPIVNLATGIPGLNFNASLSYTNMTSTISPQTDNLGNFNMPVGLNATTETIYESCITISFSASANLTLTNFAAGGDFNRVDQLTITSSTYLLNDPNSLFNIPLANTYIPKTNIKDDETWSFSINSGPSNPVTICAKRSPNMTSTNSNTRLSLNFSVVDPSSPLPVSYESFSGQALPNSNVISWKTSSEFQNLGFEIHRSFDLKNWVKIGYQQSNPEESRNYNFIDTDPSHISYYKLKQIDFNKKSEFSRIISVNNSFFDSFKVYPNPFQSYFEIKGISKIEEFKLLDANGKLINNILVEPQSSHKQYLQNLQSGKYILKGVSGRVIKLIKI